MADRLQKILSAHGIASRRKAEELIAAGRVRLNGRTAVLGDTAEPETDLIEVDGKPLRTAPEKIVLLLNKPRGYVTTVQDDKGRSTVLDLIKTAQRLYPVGRLDMYSEGLLLLTNDGELAQKLTHPKQEIDKVYHLWVSGFQSDSVARLSEPIAIDGVPIRVPEIRLLSQKDGIAMLKVTIHEGKNRQIRRMCEAAGLIPTRLKRVQEGRLLLGELKPGQYRQLTEQELAYLNSL